MRRTQVGLRSAALVLTLASLLALLPMARSLAQTPMVAVVEGTATLFAGYATCFQQGEFVGTATGRHDRAMVVAPVEASFTYCNTVIQGTAEGTIDIDIDANGVAARTCGFEWVRLGTFAVVTFDTGCSGGGVAMFVPLPTTNPPAATVAGLMITL